MLITRAPRAVKMISPCVRNSAYGASRRVRNAASPITFGSNGRRCAYAAARGGNDNRMFAPGRTGAKECVDGGEFVAASQTPMGGQGPCTIRPAATERCSADDIRAAERAQHIIENTGSAWNPEDLGVATAPSK